MISPHKFSWVKPREKAHHIHPISEHCLGDVFICSGLISTPEGDQVIVMPEDKSRWLVDVTQLIPGWNSA